MLTDDDAAVLAYLCSAGPGPLSIRGVAAGTGLQRVTVQACLHSLVVEDFICIGQAQNYSGSDYLQLLHVHPAGEDGTDGIVIA